MQEFLLHLGEIVASPLESFGLEGEVSHTRALGLVSPNLLSSAGRACVVGDIVIMRERDAAILLKIPGDRTGGGIEAEEAILTSENTGLVGLVEENAVAVVEVEAEPAVWVAAIDVDVARAVLLESLAVGAVVEGEAAGAGGDVFGGGSGEHCSESEGSEGENFEERHLV